jgi:inner membrane transporter RhtA
MARLHGQGGNAVPLGMTLTAMVSVQIGVALAKQMFAAVGAAGAVTLRVVLAAAILMAVQRVWRMSWSWAALRLVLPYGVILGLMNLCFYTALRTVPLGVVVALEFTGPLAVAVLDSRRLRDLVWVALAVLGIFLMRSPTAHGSVDPRGVLFALAAGACWGLYIVFGKRAGALGSARATTFGIMIAALVVLPFGLSQAGFRLLDAALLPRALLVAILSSALPYSLEMFAMGRLPHRIFGILMSVEPAIAALFGLLLLGESLAATQFLAILCVIAASLGSVTGIKPAGAPTPPA